MQTHTDQKCAGIPGRPVNIIELWPAALGHAAGLFRTTRIAPSSLLCLGLLMTCPAPRASAALVGYWQFNEGAGLTTADASGNGFTGTLTGSPLPVWTTSKAGLTNALDFTPFNGYVTLGNPAALQLTGPMTLSAWTYQDTLGNNGRIVTKQGNSGARGWSLGVESDNLYYFQIATSATALTWVKTTATVSQNTWTHVAGVYDPSDLSLKIYLNGILAPSTVVGTVPASMYNPSTIPVTIGNRNQATLTPYYGMLDEVRIYNRALSAADVVALAVVPEPSTLTLVLGGFAVALLGVRRFGRV